MSTYSIDRPMLIYEALELLRAYVSGIPLERVVGSGPYCIPSEAAEKIMAQCCGHLSPEDEELQFYFKTHPMEEAPVNATCVARILLYFHIQLGQAEDYFDFLKGAWGTLRQIQHCFHGIDGFSLDIKSTGKDVRFKSFPLPGSIPSSCWMPCMIMRTIWNGCGQFSHR